MGFNNAGAAALARNVMLARRHLPAGFVVGVNIGRGARRRPTEATSRDYLAVPPARRAGADYLAINVCSPNTPGLRDLQTPDRLRALLATHGAPPASRSGARPLLVKLAPDLQARWRSTALVGHRAPGRRG